MTTTLEVETGARHAPAIIEVRNAAKRFAVNGQSLTVFDGISCSIPQGAFLSIVGPSGCGKSTLLKLISGLEAPSGGEILFNGAKVTGPAEGMIYVFQQYTKSIFPWRTVIQNIEFGLNSRKKLDKRERDELCRHYVKLVGLEGYENYFPYQLSGGMQQRVVIARAILQELILNIWQTIPVTILFVTHDVEEAVFLSSRIISLTKSPAKIHEDVAIDLPYPRDQISTRADAKFHALRQQLFASIFLQEKGGAPSAPRS